jgi:hypothetical protein
MVMLIRETDLAFSLYQRAFYDKKIDDFVKNRKNHPEKTIRNLD